MWLDSRTRGPGTIRRRRVQLQVQSLRESRLRPRRRVNDTGFPSKSARHPPRPPQPGRPQLLVRGTQYGAEMTTRAADADDLAGRQQEDPGARAPVTPARSIARRPDDGKKTTLTRNSALRISTAVWRFARIRRRCGPCGPVAAEYGCTYLLV